MTSVSWLQFRAQGSSLVDNNGKFMVKKYFPEFSELKGMRWEYGQKKYFHEFNIGNEDTPTTFHAYTNSNENVYICASLHALVSLIFS